MAILIDVPPYKDSMENENNSEFWCCLRSSVHPLSYIPQLPDQQVVI